MSLELFKGALCPMNWQVNLPAAPPAFDFRLLQVSGYARFSLSICVIFFLVTATDCALGQGDITKHRIEALLGLRDVAVTPEQWLGLDADAGVLLEAIAADPRELPSRRCRAFEGMVVLRTAHAIDLLVQTAHAEAEPGAVRMAAMRGLGRVLPATRVLTELRPILEEARDARVRGIAAEVLSQDSLGCAEVRKQAAKETPAWRARFLTGDCAEASTTQAPRTPPNPADSAARAGQNSSEPSDPPAPNATSVGPVETIDLGVYNLSTTTLTAPISITVPQNALSLDFIGVALSDPTARVVVYYLNSPTERVYSYASSSNLMKVLPPSRAGGFSVTVPNSPTVPLVPGQWTVQLLASKVTTASVQVLLKRSPTDSPAAGTLNLNLFFVGLSGLNASSAQTDANFQVVLNRARTRYNQVGITIGSLSYIDVTGDAATMYSDLKDADLGALMQLSNLPGAQANAVNIFFVHTIAGESLSGFVILGESAGIPGAPILGNPQSGVAVAMSDFPSGLNDIGDTCSHETGHWLGFFHTTESAGTAFDSLPDTPQCVAATYDTNHDGLVLPGECSSVDGPNLMFWTSDPSVSLGLLTANQGFVLLRHPVVVTSQPFPLAINSVTYLTNNNTIHLQCVGLPDAVNRIESSPDLSPNSFTTLTSVSVDATGNFHYDDTNAGTKKSYRLAYP